MGSSSVIQGEPSENKSMILMIINLDQPQCTRFDSLFQLDPTFQAQQLVMCVVLGCEDEHGSLLYEFGDREGLVD
jgi:hypothetical protein